MPSIILPAGHDWISVPCADTTTFAWHCAHPDCPATCYVEHDLDDTGYRLVVEDAVDHASPP